MKEFTFDAEQWLPRSRAEIFPFFASAENLEMITPPWLNFEVLTLGPIQMKVGVRIDYRLRVHGIPIRWQSEITAWEPPFRFVDEQRRGPYRSWIHEHRFEEQKGGTLCLDHVRYAPPGGWLADRLFVRVDVARIFAFRTQQLTKMFTSPGSGSVSLG